MSSEINISVDEKKINSRKNSSGVKNSKSKTTNNKQSRKIQLSTLKIDDTINDNINDNINNTNIIDNDSTLITPKIDILENNNITQTDDIEKDSKLVYNKLSNIYTKKVINKRVTIHISKINLDLNKILEDILSENFNAKCNIEGFIKPNTIKILSFSCGVITSNYVIFDVSFECLVCCPTEGSKIDVVIKNITKAGIRAEINDNPTPLVIFISRTTNTRYNALFDKLTENQMIKVKIIGKRYELNDKFISVIAELTN